MTKHNELSLMVQHPYQGRKPMRFTITQVPVADDEVGAPCVWSIKIDGDRIRGVVLPQISNFGLADAMNYVLSHFTEFAFNDPTDEWDEQEPLGFAILDAWGAEAMDKLGRDDDRAVMKVARPS